MKLLEARLNRLKRWHSEGLLCIGEATHAMSPAGGVGVRPEHAPPFARR